MPYVIVVTDILT